MVIKWVLVAVIAGLHVLAAMIGALLRWRRRRRVLALAQQPASRRAPAALERRRSS